jgi:hypothetical protein
MIINPDEIRKAKELLAARCRYEKATPSLPKWTIKLAVIILAIGFIGLGIVSLKPLSIGAGVLIGTTFLAIAIII